MGYPQLLFLGHFPECPLIGWIAEYGVVAEPRVAARSVGYFPFDDAGRFIRDRSRMYGCHRANKSRIPSAPGNFAEPPVDLGKSLGIRSIGPQESRRMHARLAIERVN